MNDKAIVFEKIRQLFLSNGFDERKYYFSFSSFPIEFTNEDFNFLNGETKDADAAKEDYNDKWSFSLLANSINRDPHIWNLLQNERIFDEEHYSFILEKAVKIDPQLSDEEKQLYEQSKKILYNDSDAFEKTDHYKLYQEYVDKIASLNTKLDAKNTEKQQIDSKDGEALNKWQQESDDLNNQLSILKADWQIKGFKKEIQDALKSIGNSNDKQNFIVEWNHHLREYNSLAKENNPVNNIDFLPTYCNPQGIYLSNFGGWKAVAIEKAELEKLDNEAKDYLGADVYNSFDSLGTTFSKIEFEILFVEIARSWLRKDLLESRYWKFPSDITQTLSDGENLKTGLMPSFPTQMVFTRHLKYSVEEDNKHSDTSQPSTLNTVKKVVFKDLVNARLTPASDKKLNIKFQIPKIINRQKAGTAIFFKPAGFAPSLLKIASKSSGAVIRDHTDIPKEGQTRGQFVWVKDHWERKKAMPSEPATFALTVKICDSQNKPLPEISVRLKSVKTAGELNALTNDAGELIIPGLERDNYEIFIQDEEYFEDYHETLALKSDVNKTINLVNRKNPKIRFSLLGIVNYKFPKLPDPIEGISYS